MEGERTPAIMADERVRSVRWRDLRTLSRGESFGELVMPLPWLALSLGLADAGHYGWALPASFMFFLTGLRQIHDGYHGNLGLSRRGDDVVMFVQSLLMMSAMHAVKINHLRHHRLCMAEGDLEAKSARMSAFGAIAFGPLFPFLLLREAFRSGPVRDRRWMKVELAGIALWVVLVFGALDWAALRYHVLAMCAGECLTAFFCVWTVHHGCDREHFIARTSRRRFWNAFFYDMFFHVEHHLFPGVPTRHLHRLAGRVDAAMPELCRKDVWVIEDVLHAAPPAMVPPWRSSTHHRRPYPSDVRRGINGAS